jgi:virginiamycin B lyase
MEEILSLLVKLVVGVLFAASGLYPVAVPKTAEVKELKATIRDWDVPTKGAKPYATAVTSDGLVWFTEETANKIGSFNPNTGEFKEYSLTEDKNASPHGITSDHDGNLWYTANSGGFLGKLDPKTGKVTVFKISDPKAKDPESLAFDSKGILWFTLPMANMVGKLDPASGQVVVKVVPTENARPNGILVLKRGLPIFAESGSSKIGFITPDTFAIHEYPLPPGSRSRRLALAADQNTVYFTDFVSGNLGKLDISIGALVMFPSPGGPDSNPYGLSITPDGMVWYTETGTQPNNIIRFDPQSFSFARAAIPFATGVVNTVTATPEGRVYIVGTDKIGVIETAAK